MCKCLLVLPFLICLNLTQIFCQDEVADSQDVSIIIQEPRTKQVTSDLDGGQGHGSRIRQWQKKLLWTRKRSFGSSVTTPDSLDMQGWLETGLPSVEYSVLSSPSNCCANYSKTIQGAKNTHIRLVILDIYLLPGSNLTILEAEEDDLPPSSRPTMAQSIANVLHITIDQPETTNDPEFQEQPSFTALYWEVPVAGEQWRRKPYAQCPIAHQAVYGGQVVLKSAPVSPQDYIYDCIWVIRKPSTGWSIYVKIIEMQLHGLVEVRDGLHATSPLIVSNRNGSSLESLRQPEVGYWSSDHGGLYLRVIKPVNEGFLTFVYGIAKMKVDEFDDCKFRYLGFDLMPGWHCQEPSVCIPLNHTCNGVNNCPLGQDELYCDTEDECKHAFEKWCWTTKGCVHRLLEFCPEDKCPQDRPFRCDYFTKCYSQLEKCNGLVYCDDGKDERGCPKTSKGLSTKTIVIIVCVSGLFTILPSVILCCWDDPVERDLQRAQEAFTNLCDLYSGRTLLTQIQAARRAGTLGVDQEARTTNHRPTFQASTNQEEVILLNPQDHAETQTHTADNAHLSVPAVETASPRRPPRTLPNVNSQHETHESSSTSPTRGSNSTPEYSPPNTTRDHLSPPPYLLQPDVAALEHPLPEERQNHDPPPYLIPPGGATADGLPPDTEGPPPYESVQHMSPDTTPQGEPGHPPAYSH